MNLQLLFVEDLDNPVVARPDIHHLNKVLRIKFGEQITISDGKGRWRKCRFGSIPDDLEEIQSTERPLPKLGVGFSLIKGGRSDLAVAKLTEIGVDFITPFFAERSVVKYTGKEPAAQIQRWKRIIREAAMQSRRAFLPEIYEHASFEEIVSREKSLPENSTAGLARCDMSGASHRTLEQSSIVYLLVGPEGGWSDSEREMLKDEICLAPNVLRSETAAILAGAVLVQNRRNQQS